MTRDEVVVAHFAKVDSKKVQAPRSEGLALGEGSGEDHILRLLGHKVHEAEEEILA